jgi:hypothetical protein
MKIYIAGPMEPVGYDRNAFLKAAAQLREAEYRVANPVGLPVRDSREARQRDRLREILDASGVAVLDGWQTSAIAAFEVMVAQRLNLPVLTVNRWIEVAS